MYIFVVIDDWGFSNIYVGSEFKQGFGVVFVLFFLGQCFSVNFWSYIGVNFSKQGVEVGYFYVRLFFFGVGFCYYVVNF